MKMKEKFQNWKKEHQEEIDNAKKLTIIFGTSLGACFACAMAGKYAERMKIGIGMEKARADGFLALTKPMDDGEREEVLDSREWNKIVQEYYGIK